MKRIGLTMVLAILFCTAKAQHTTTLFEQSGGKQSPTYFEIIDWWKKLDAKSTKVKMQAMDTTDAGYPLHLILVNNAGVFDIKKLKAAGKSILFVNNGIHPGEPDGINASMLLVRDIVEGKEKLPDNVVLAIIPVYNIGGCINRSKNYRIDQNGPEIKGFRGNAENYDLNRDFIKMDSKEAWAFAKIFHLLDPDIFVDNHVSNGADYQHVMTLLTTQKNKIGNVSGAYLHNTVEPFVYKTMQAKGITLVPYVNHWGNNTPDVGWNEFWDSPRYGSGYGALFNTFSFVPETHMLKPYKQRVEATYSLMESFIAALKLFGNEIKLTTKKAAELSVINQKEFAIKWKVDSSAPSKITFNGYDAGYKTSEVSGLQRLYYDRSKPYTKQIPFYNNYVPTQFVTKPKAYIIPQGWWKVIDRLKVNGVQMKRLQKDTIIYVQWYHIDSYKASPRAYEGHHLNQEVKVNKNLDSMQFRKGDYLILLNQKANHFLIETLEPEAEDSYFAWNFFDPILQQKEYFSDYVFEETAMQYLQQHPDVKAKLEAKKASDTAFAKSGAAQLDFVFRNSPYYEPDYLRYPVYSIMEK